MNRSDILHILGLLAAVAVLALAGVGLEHTVAALSRGSGSGPTAQIQPTATAIATTPPPAQVQLTPTAVATTPPPAQVQPTATAMVAPPTPAQIQPTATAPVMTPPAVQVKVEGHIIAVNAAARTITVQDDDGGPTTVVALGAVRGSFYAWQKVEVYGTATSPGSNGATVQAQLIRFKDPDGYAAAPGATIKVEGHIIAVDRAAGTITVQDDDGPPTVVALGAVKGTFYPWQKVEVYGTVTSPGSNGVTVQAQFIQLKDPDGYAAAPGAPIKVEGRITAVNTAAGSITVQDDDGPATVVALGAARGNYYVWQKVEVYGTVTSAGSNGVTVQAQFIKLND
jgi:hypothetical protein